MTEQEGVSPCLFKTWSCLISYFVTLHNIYRTSMLSEPKPILRFR